MKNTSGILVLGLLLSNLVCIGSQVIHVATEGSDSNSGSRASPFKTIRTALEFATPGATIEIAPGIYRETIELRNKRNLNLQAAEPGTVQVNVSRALPKQWKLGAHGIWSQKLEYDIWQLFSGNRLVYLARWPDATFEDGKIWRMMESCRSTDGGYNQRKGSWDGKTHIGIVYDDGFHKPAVPGFTEGDSRYVHDSSIGFEDQPPSLASTGIDFTGALAVLNLGHWMTYTQPIVSHAAGSDHFTYSTKLIGHDQSALKHFKKRYASYHILGLPALDQSNEWWFDAKTRTAYYKPEAGVNPNTEDLQGRTVDFAVKLTACSFIHFENIDFFAGGFSLNQSNDSGFMTCRFDYPATHKFLLNAFQWFANHNPDSSPNKMSGFLGGARNYFLNCIVNRSNAPVAFVSDASHVENSLFTDIEWQVNSNGGSGSVMIGKDGIFRRNTVQRAGNCEGVRAIDNGAIIELNRISDVGNLQHDGAAINVGTTKHAGTRVAYNWTHDTNRQGLRFDYHGEKVFQPDGKIYGDGVFMYNVSWNTMINQVKGDRHLVLNNTVVNCSRYPDPKKEQVTLAIQGFRSMHGIMGNMNSLIRNNIATIKNRSWNLDATVRPGWRKSDGYMPPLASEIPGQADHNALTPGASYQHLRDPKNHDFRPRAHSPLIDAGATVSQVDLPSKISNFTRQRILGKAPDIGAYEFGDARYWIPGRKGSLASTPVPRNHGIEVPLDADLMFLEAYQVTQHRVLFGTHPDTLMPIALLMDSKSNIVTPPALEPSTQYYWRVDAKDSTNSKRWRIGKVWHFTTAAEREESTLLQSAL